MKEGITRESCCCQSRTGCRFCLLLRNGCRCCLNRRYRPNCPCRSLPRLFRSSLPGNRICRLFLPLPSPRPCCSCRIASKTRIRSLTVLYFYVLLSTRPSGRCGSVCPSGSPTAAVVLCLCWLPSGACST